MLKHPLEVHHLPIFQGRQLVSLQQAVWMGFLLSANSLDEMLVHFPCHLPPFAANNRCMLPSEAELRWLAGERAVNLNGSIKHRY